MVFFSDFGKKVSDLFKKKDYELQRSVKLKCKSGKTEWTTESRFAIEVDGQSTTKTKYKQNSGKFGAITLEIPNNKPMKVDYETPNLMDGLQMNLISEASKVSLETECERGQIAAKCSVSTSTSNPSKLGLTAEVARDIGGLWFGGEVEYDTEEGPKGYMAGVSYTDSDTQVVLQGNLKELKVHLHSKCSETGEVAADYHMDLKENIRMVSVGGKWQVDEKCSVQGFIQSDGNSYLLYKHKLSDYCTAHFGSTFGCSSVKDNVNVHYKLEFTA